MPWTMFDTSIGACGLAWNATGLTGFLLPEGSDEKTEARLRAKDPASTIRATKLPSWVTKLISQTKKHLDGDAQNFAGVPLDLERVTTFEGDVYRALQHVPSGKIVSYGDLAKAVGSPGASRAIGRAMATNPFPIVVPCHRVLAASGNGGFSAYGGVVTKERLLAIEGFSLAQHAAKKARNDDDDAEPSLFASVNEIALPYDRALAIAHLSSKDSVLRDHVSKIGAFTLSLKQSEGTFAALAESIVYQQLNGKAAASIFGRVRALFPKDGFAPRALLKTSDEQLRGAGLSQNKLLALRDLARRAEEGKVPTLAQLRAMDDDAIVDILTEVRGIGRWTVEMLLIFRLGRPDVLPIADYGIKKGYARVFHRGALKKEELPKDADLVKRAERWRPFRSVASWYLWRAAEMPKATPTTKKRANSAAQDGD